jgi:UPF0755 protein
MWRSIASNALTLFIVLLVVAAGALAWARKAYDGAGPLVDPICFRVERGDKLSEVSRALEAQGAVSDARIFRIGANYADKAGGLKFGSYLLPPKSSMAEVVALLTTSGQSTCGREVNFRIGIASADVVLRELDPATNRYVEVVKFDPATEAVPAAYLDVVDEPDLRWRVTLAEGVTSWQAVEALKRADFLEGTVADIPPEGSLSPDSYEVDRGSEKSALIAEMTDRQTDDLAEAWAARADGLPYKTPEEALIMASIVEKETGIPEERKQVASVFINRLAQGMRLQTDPTVIYGITKGEGILGRGLRQSELRRETPWNTYVIDGLPQTPIANPGQLAIEAALNPDTTKYLFFVADGTGGHAFAETLEAHNENVAKWRAIEAERGEEATGVQGE